MDCSLLNAKCLMGSMSSFSSTHPMKKAMALASLPAQMLYVAAQFASADPAKQALTGILVRPEKDGGVRIDSTDGHRAFNVTCPDPTWHCRKPLLLSPKSFIKRIPHAKIVEICSEKNTNTATILGGKSPEPTYMMSVPWRWELEGFVVVDPATKYPDIDKLWPDSFHNSPSRCIGFNAAYMIDFCSQVKRYSWNQVVRMEFNGATNPILLTSAIHGDGLNDVVMRYLLLPVQIRT